LPVEVSITKGLDPAIDRVAAMAHDAWRFLSRSWFAAAGPQEMSTVLLSGAEGGPLIALPVATIGPLRAVPGGYWPFRSFPVADSASAEDMAALLSDRKARRALGRLWRIGPVYANDPALLLVRDAAPKAGWHICERTISTAYLLDMKSLAAEGEWPRNSTLRKNRFHEKHLASHGQLEWRFARGSDWTPELFADLAAIEEKSWHAGASDPKFMPGPHREVWERLAHDPEQAERMNAAILYVDGKPAAFSFDLDVAGRKYAIANSYDPAYAKHSPGKCLYYRNLAEAMERGIDLVDWGAGDGGYKQTIGAVAGPRIMDCLIIRKGWLTPFIPLIALIWKATGRSH
jgi:CelD/BcsL family acetyltransferase involved in cellulose biosynthesis